MIIGCGGAMMMWRTAWGRAFTDSIRGPLISPMARDKVRPTNEASWEYYRLLDQVDMCWRLLSGPELAWIRL